jgi:hypothetical protein
MMKYEYLGTTDEVTTCDCCGKTNLKNTVVIRDLDTGEDLYFGVSCAAKALKVQVADVKKGTAEADRKRAEEERARREAEQRAEHARWVAYLIEQTGGIYDYNRSPDVFRMIQALGGFAAAKAGYRTSAKSNPRRRVRTATRRNPARKSKQPTYEEAMEAAHQRSLQARLAAKSMVFLNYRDLDAAIKARDLRALAGHVADSALSSAYENGASEETAYREAAERVDAWRAIRDITGCDDLQTMRDDDLAIISVFAVALLEGRYTDFQGNITRDSFGRPILRRTAR